MTNSSTVRRSSSMPTMRAIPSMTGGMGQSMPEVMRMPQAVPTPIPMTPPGELSPQTLENPAYMAGFLKTQIGKRMRIEFLIGTSMLTDRSGVLLSVGANYILLREEGIGNTELCDLYAIKFVHIFQ